MKSLFLLSLYLCLLKNILTYNPVSAVRYARNWWNRRNPKYIGYLDYGNDDESANFVSQCIIPEVFQLPVVRIIRE